MYPLVQLQRLLDSMRVFDFLGPLALRLYLVPIFWMAGTKKLEDIDSISEWFGNPDWGLGLPFPEVMAWLATLTETGGAIMLLVLFFIGAGRFFSMDYWIRRAFMR